MGNLIVGILFIIGGASGEFVVRGTNSSGLLVVLGVGLVLKGMYDLSKGKRVRVEGAEPKVALKSVKGPEEAIGASAYDAETQRYLGKLQSVSKKDGTCTIKNDFGEEFSQEISETLVLEPKPVAAEPAK